MKNRLVQVSVLLLLFLPTELFAQMEHEDTGAQLLKDCTYISEGAPFKSKWQVPPAFRCLGLIEGIIVMNASMGERLQKFCPPNDVTSKDAARSITSMLRSRPTLQKWSYAFSAVLALRQAYPCHREG